MALHFASFLTVLNTSLVDSYPLHTLTMTILPSGPIAQKLIRRLTIFNNRKVVELRSFATGRQHSETLQKSVASRKTLDGLHPAHAIYVYLQNQVSVLSETISELPPLAELAKNYEEAERTYMPSGPPMSPLTYSYFFFWGVFDAAVGPARETLGTSIVAVIRWAGAHPEFVRLIEVMQQSRMGLYVHDGVEKSIVYLREFITDERLPCIVPAGYLGQRGEIWLVRVLPPPAPAFTQSVVMTTPYIIQMPRRDEWQSYLDRTLPKLKVADRFEAYARLMKYGLTFNHWNEYLVDAYVGSQASAIFLRGIPDISSSLPHSPHP